LYSGIKAGLLDPNQQNSFLTIQVHSLAVTVITWDLFSPNLHWQIRLRSTNSKYSLTWSKK